MEIRSYLALILPFAILFYGSVLLAVRPTRRALFTSWISGLVMAIASMLFDIIAINLHWWHYESTELILGLPLPLYLAPFLIYGGLMPLVVWRFWRKSLALARVFLIGTPIFGILLNAYYAYTHGSLIEWDQFTLSFIWSIVMWGVAFSASFLIFRRFSGFPWQPEEESVSEVRA